MKYKTKLNIHVVTITALALLSGSQFIQAETLPEANYLTNSGEIWPTSSRTLDSIEDYSVYAPNLELSKYGGWVHTRRYLAPNFSSTIACGTGSKLAGSIVYEARPDDTVRRSVM